MDRGSLGRREEEEAKKKLAPRQNVVAAVLACGLCEMLLLPASRVLLLCCLAQHREVVNIIWLHSVPTADSHLHQLIIQGKITTLGLKGYLKNMDLGKSIVNNFLHLFLRVDHVRESFLRVGLD